MTVHRHFAIIAVLPLALAFATMTRMASAETASPAGAKAYIIAPADGAEVTSPFAVKFGLTGMGVAPAGVEKDKTGHHHLFIDTTFAPTTEPIPADDQHKHFGGGQTETMLSLAPGQHTLQLVMGDQNHVPHVPPVVSDLITVTIK